MAVQDPRGAHEIAKAASAFEEGRTGHPPRSVSVVLAADTLVVTLHGTLSEAEKLLARTPEGAAQVQEFHRRLFEDAADPLRAEISGSRGWPSGRPARPSSRRPGPWSRCSRPGPWSRSSSWPARSPRARGPAARPTSPR